MVQDHPGGDHHGPAQTAAILCLTCRAAAHKRYSPNVNTFPTVTKTFNLHLSPRTSRHTSPAHQPRIQCAFQQTPLLWYERECVSNQGQTPNVVRKKPLQARAETSLNECVQKQNSSAGLVSWSCTLKGQDTSVWRENNLVQLQTWTLSPRL